VGKAYNTQLLGGTPKSELNRKNECPISKTNECLIKHPTQLQTTEHDIVKQYCENETFKNWVVYSVL
jgi:hypothetical protein